MSWPISILDEEQKPSDPGGAPGTLDWLRDQLWRASVIELGAPLQVSPSDCTVKCRLEVLDRENDITLGFIELGASEGFPGEVGRVDTDGNEISRWRLKGDLTWEAQHPKHGAGEPSGRYLRSYSSGSYGTRLPGVFPPGTICSYRTDPLPGTGHRRRCLQIPLRPGMVSR